MGTLEQITVSLKGDEIVKWNKLKQMYPDKSKHDVVYFSILSLLNKNSLKKNPNWKKLQEVFPETNDWEFIKRIMEEAADSVQTLTQ